MAITNPFKLPSQLQTLSAEENYRRALASQTIPAWANGTTQYDGSSSMMSEHHRHKLIAMRLRIREGQKMPYQDLFTSLAGDKVFVFVVQDNQAVTLEDEATMFPSDQLITQLRLLDK